MKALVIVCMLASAAYAEAPWEKDVPRDSQDRANTMFADANLLFGQQAHAAALEKYREAIALWDHPLIRFNMGVTLVRMDRFVDAADALDRSLRFGAEPFPSAEQHRQALDYQKLVAGRIGTIEASCTQPGVQVSLDGKRWFACPARERVRVLAGEHAIVGEAAGLMTRSDRHNVAGGKTVTTQIELLPVSSAIQLVYPTRRWIPWTTVAGGAAVLLSGAAVWVAGRNQLDRFDAQYTRECATSCETDLSAHPALRDQRDGALLKTDLGTAMMIAGGVVAGGGAVWALVFNRPRQVRTNVEVTPAGAGVRASWRF